MAVYTMCINNIISEGVATTAMAVALAKLFPKDQDDKVEQLLQVTAGDKFYSLCISYQLRNVICSTFAMKPRSSWL